MADAAPWLARARARYDDGTRRADLLAAYAAQGSETALIDGTSTFGPMSREMKQKESEDFEKKFGYKPTRIAVAVDTLAMPSDVITERHDAVSVLPIGSSWSTKM